MYTSSPNEGVHVALALQAGFFVASLRCGSLLFCAVPWRVAVGFGMWCCGERWVRLGFLGGVESRELTEMALGN